jgi:hypothetical protein
MVSAKRPSFTRPVLPPDPVADVLAACFRQLLAQLATAEKATGAVLTAEGDGPNFDQPSPLAEMDRRELTAAT